MSFKGPIQVWESYFKILGNYSKSKFRCKINEPLFMSYLKPTLHLNKKQISLHLIDFSL